MRNAFVVVSINCLLASSLLGGVTFYSPSVSASPPSNSAIGDAGFSIPSVNATAPTLRVELRNESQVPLPMVDYSEPTCFAERWLRFEVTDSRGRALKQASCATRERGIAKPIAPGGSAKFSLPLAIIFPSLVAGTYKFHVAWQSASPADGFSVLSSSLNETKFTIGAPKATISIKRGETVTLPDGAKLTFEGHSHKDVDERSAPGPLIVGGHFAPPHKPPAQFYVSIFESESRVFSLGGSYTFELVESVYGESMKLKYYGDLH